MIRRPDIQLDTRDAAQIVQEVLQRRLGYVPEWQPPEQSADAALVWVFAHYLQTILQRLQQAPDKNELAFLDLLGLSLVPASAARAPIVFQLAADSPDSLAPANTQVAAPPPPGSNSQIVFETERTVGLAAAQLQEVVSLWPGRDQYLEHTAAFLAGEPFQLFRKPLLHNTPHHLFMAHNTLLALSGSALVEVEMELTQPGSEPLRLLWHYWDGKVWRGFQSVRPACSEKEAEYADSTAGLTRSGRFVLAADCAESAKTVVNGSEAFWIRAQLDEPLLPDPATALPQIASVRLSTITNVPLQATLAAVIRSNTVFAQDAVSSRLQGTVTNEAGQALASVKVKITSPDDANFVQKSVNTNNNGEYDSDRIAAQHTYEMQVAFLTLEASTRLRNLELNRDFGVDLTFQVVGLDPDQAFADGTQLDVTKPFYPFGQQPQPGAAFYFTQAEVFNKPSAQVQIYVAPTETPLDSFNITTTPATPETPRTMLPHLIAWEYWNGQRWVTMLQSSDEKAAGVLNATGIIELTVPPDIAPTLVNEQEGLWMRARLVSGGFGFKTTIPTNAGRNTTNNFTFVITQPPALAAFRMGYSWRHGPFHPEQVLTYNDFQYEDHTYEAIWPGNTFVPFTYVRDITPALYLGFDKKLPVAQIGLYVDIVEQRGATSGPALVWESYDGASWRELAATDETHHLRVPGMVTFIAAEDSQPLARFGTARHWVRGRLKEDGPPGEPTINSIFTNAVWAAQRQILNDVVLGTSSGLPNQVLRFSQIPVLAGERLEVQELSGRRANVEWRLLARELAPNNANIVQDLAALLGREDGPPEVIQGDLRLRRDRNKQVVEVWIRWQEQPHLLHSGADDRHYVIDRARGLVFFGNGEQGRIPPPGSPLLVKQYRAGGGLAGNVAARTITQLLGALSGVQAVLNPRAAEGGADGETLESFRERGPQALRHRGRAITPADYEALAHEASPAVAIARAIPTRNASGRPMPGWITLLIIPQSEERRPWPSFGLRQQVSNYLAERAPAGLTAVNQIYVTGPDYLPIDVTATLAPREASEAGAVEARVRQALETFLHPLRGGPTGHGWELGRHLYLSDVAAVLERVPGVDYVEELALSVNGTLQGERVTITAERMMTAGQIRLTLQIAEG